MSAQTFIAALPDGFTATMEEDKKGAQYVAFRRGGAPGFIYGGALFYDALGLGVSVTIGGMMTESDAVAVAAFFGQLGQDA